MILIIIIHLLKKRKNKLTINNNLTKINNIQPIQQIKKEIQPNSNNKITLNPDSNEDIKEKIKTIMELDDEELNNLSYELNVLLKLLALSESIVSEYKKNKNKEELNKKEKDLLSNIKNKILLYFIISFALSLLYSLVIYLFPGLFRIPSLSDKKNGKPCRYKFSTLLQMI